MLIKKKAETAAKTKTYAPKYSARNNTEIYLMLVLRTYSYENKTFVTFFTRPLSPMA